MIPINDLLFKIKKTLSLDNETIIKAYALADYEISRERLDGITVENPLFYSIFLK